MLEFVGCTPCALTFVHVLNAEKGSESLPASGIPDRIRMNDDGDIPIDARGKAGCDVILCQSLESTGRVNRHVGITVKIEYRKRSH